MGRNGFLLSKAALNTCLKRAQHLDIPGVCACDDSYVRKFAANGSAGQSRNFQGCWPIPPDQLRRFLKPKPKPPTICSLVLGFVVPLHGTHTRGVSSSALLSSLDIQEEKYKLLLIFKRSLWRTGQ